MKFSDQEVVNCINRGGIKAERCITWLFNQYKGWVVALSKENDQPEEDVLSAYIDGIMALCKQIKCNQFKGEAKLSSYLYRIVKNKCIDAYRKNTTNKATRMVLREPSYETEDEKSDLLKVLIDNEEVMRIKQLFVRLDTFCRNFLNDALFKDYLTEELMQKYKLETARQVRNRKFRCLEGLRTIIARKE